MTNSSRKYFLTFPASIAVSLVIFCASSFAVGDATKCEVTVQAIFLKNISGDWIKIKDSSRQANLMVEEPLLSFINYDRVPPGKYVNFKVILSETFKISGKDGDNFTKAGGEITVGGTAIKASALPGTITALKVTSPVWNTEKEGEITEHLNLDFEDQNDTIEIYPRRNFQKPLLIKKGSAVHIWMTISLTRTIYFAFPNMIKRGVPKENVMYFLPPEGVDDVSMSVDAASRFASEDEVEIDF